MKTFSSIYGGFTVIYVSVKLLIEHNADDFREANTMMAYIWLAIEVSSSLIEPLYYHIMCFILQRSDKVLQDKINKLAYKI
jgi:hypothetical protein